MIGVGVDRVPGARTRTVVAQQHAIQQGRDRVEIVAECETKRVNGLQVGLASGLIREEELNGLRVNLIVLERAIRRFLTRGKPPRWANPPAMIDASVPDKARQMASR